MGLSKLGVVLLGAVVLLAGCAVSPGERVASTSHSPDAPISIYAFGVDGPNAVGGVGVYVYFVNPSKTTYKYVRMWFSARNRVGDVVVSEIGRKRDAGIEEIGPFGFGDGSSRSGDRFGPLWYNASIACVVLEKVELVALDNSSKTFDSEAVKQLVPRGATTRCDR